MNQRSGCSYCRCSSGSARSVCGPTCLEKLFLWVLKFCFGLTLFMIVIHSLVRNKLHMHHIIPQHINTCLNSLFLASCFRLPPSTTSWWRRKCLCPRRSVSQREPLSSAPWRTTSGSWESLTAGSRRRDVWAEYTWKPRKRFVPALISSHLWDKRQHSFRLFKIHPKFRILG